MRALASAIIGLGLAAVLSPAQATDCPGNPGALGVSRVLTIDPATTRKLGTIQYQETLPLEPKEVVLTFDDGPMPPYTNRVLEALAAECVKANYFIVGRMARGYPDLLRRIHAEGHVIGTHSENHPLAFDKMSLAEVRTEIETGIASTGSALRNPAAVAPFFRIPGLLRAEQVETYLRQRRLTAWSADITGDDWKHLPSAEIVKRVMQRLDEKGRGIILLHDIQPATALALPEILRLLKKGGYRIVQVAPGAEPAPRPAPAVAGGQPAASPQIAAAPAGPPALEPVRLQPMQASAKVADLPRAPLAVAVPPANASAAAAPASEPLRPATVVAAAAPRPVAPKSERFAPPPNPDDPPPVVVPAAPPPEASRPAPTGLEPANETVKAHPRVVEQGPPAPAAPALPDKAAEAKAQDSGPADAAATPGTEPAPTASAPAAMPEVASAPASPAEEPTPAASLPTRPFTPETKPSQSITTSGKLLMPPAEMSSAPPQATPLGMAQADAR